MKLIDWILGLFSKPKEEVTFDRAVTTAWPFPVEEPAKPKRKYVRKATTRKVKPTVKKTVKKKAK
jgi:hypothetical protein